MKHLRVWGLVLAMGCAANDDSQLGIARFDVRETAEETIVLGLAADGEEVGRLELVHGRFSPAGSFAEDLGDAEIAGRSLRVAVRGQELLWQTAGFDPTLEMPAHPASQWAIAAFLRDPHVAPVLARWGIGFLDAAAPSPGYSFAINGTHPRDCTGQAKCPTMFAESPSPNTCGGASSVPTSALIVHQRGVDWDGIPGESELHGNQYRAAFWGATVHNQSVIAQCCPADATRKVPEAFFGLKTCPDPCGAPDAVCPSTCGSTKFGACVGCQQYYIATDRCALETIAAGWLDPHAPHDLVMPSGADKLVWDVNYWVGQSLLTTIPGGSRAMK